MVLAISALSPKTRPETTSSTAVPRWSEPKIIRSR